MRPFEELIDDSEATWTLLQDWSLRASNSVSLLSVDVDQRSRVLYDLQVTTKSVLGTMAYYTGGVLVDHGWLRFLGAGCDLLPRNLSAWNQIIKGKSTRFSGALLIADDIVGGFFAINGGAFNGKTGDVFYLAPDTLEWESLGMSYSDFVNWSFSADLKKFYETFRWTDWTKEVMRVSGNEGILIYPFLWAEGDEVSHRSRKVVPVEELWNLNIQNREKFGIN